MPMPVPTRGWIALRRDRKSTRLNSSHLGISYAVFCLKKTTSVHQPQEHVHGSFVAATQLENITRIPSVPPTPTSKLPSQEVLALFFLGSRDPETFPPFP